MNVNGLFSKCRRFRRTAALMVSGEATEAEARAMRQHAATCSPCREHMAQLQTVSSLLRETAMQVQAIPEPDEQMAFGWRRAIRQAAAAEAHRTSRRSTLATILVEWLGLPRPASIGLVATWVGIIALHWTAPKVDSTAEPGLVLPMSRALSLLRSGDQDAAWLGFVPEAPPPKPATKPEAPRGERARNFILL